MYPAISENHLFLHFSPILVQSPMTKYYKWLFALGHYVPAKINGKWGLITGTSMQNKCLTVQISPGHCTVVIFARTCHPSENSHLDFTLLQLNFSKLHTMLCFTAQFLEIACNVMLQCWSLRKSSQSS